MWEPVIFVRSYKNTIKGTSPPKICLLIINCLRGKQMKTKVVLGLGLIVICKTGLEEDILRLKLPPIFIYSFN